MEIKTFQSHHLDTLRRELSTAIKGVTDKYGLTFSIGTMRFGPSEFRTKLTVNTKNPSPSIQSVFTNALTDAFEGEEIKMEIIGENKTEEKTIIPGFHNEFISRGERFVVTGYVERRHKYPVSARKKYDHSGLGYKFTLEALNPIIADLKK